jgi:hypothetical protein
MADDDRHDRGCDDLGVTILAHLGREALRIVEALGDAVGIEDHGGDDHRPRPRSAPGLVDPGHGAAMEAHQLLLAVEGGRGAERERLGGQSHGPGLWRKGHALCKGEAGLVRKQERVILRWPRSGPRRTHRSSHPSRLALIAPQDEV